MNKFALSRAAVCVSVPNIIWSNLHSKMRAECEPCKAKIICMCASARVWCVCGAEIAREEFRAARLLPAHNVQWEAWFLWIIGINSRAPQWSIYHQTGNLLFCFLACAAIDLSDRVSPWTMLICHSRAARACNYHYPSPGLWKVLCAAHQSVNISCKHNGRCHSGSPRRESTRLHVQSSVRQTHTYYTSSCAADAASAHKTG